MKRTISVTKKDIELGDRDNCKACPIALAARRTFKSRKQTVRVFPLNLWIGETTYELPDEARRFVDDFDCGFQVEPFKFKVSNDV